MNWINSKIIMYGIGCVGKGVLSRLKYLNANLLGIAVTSVDDTNKKEAEMNDLEIKSIIDWKGNEEDVVLIAVSEKYQNEIKSNCEKNGFHNLVYVTPELMEKISMLCYEKWFKGNNIDIAGEYLLLGNGKYLNPFKNNMPNRFGFLGQLGDYVIPEIYNDYTFVNEGTYEYGKVVVDQGDVVFDLGANLGSFSVYAASKDATSYAFEPTPFLKSIIEKHSAVNGNRINHVNYAVSDKSGEVNFYINPSVCGGNTIFENRISSTETITVKTIGIDEFIRDNNIEKVDFIKADIEGAERQMLMGAFETLKKFAPKLSLCTYHLPDDKEVLTELILKANPNYKIAYKWEKLYAWVENQK